MNLVNKIHTKHVLFELNFFLEECSLNLKELLNRHPAACPLLGKNHLVFGSHTHMGFHHGIRWNFTTLCGRS